MRNAGNSLDAPAVQRRAQSLELKRRERESDREIANEYVLAACERESGEDIVGHAFEYDRIVITEMPKPWPRDTSGVKGPARVLHELVD